jgi:hypothetical protein
MNNTKRMHYNVIITIKGVSLEEAKKTLLSVFDRDFHVTHKNEPIEFMETICVPFPYCLKSKHNKLWQQIKVDYPNRYLYIETYWIDAFNQTADFVSEIMPD